MIGNIYIIQNNYNHKVYIGQTIKPIGNRFKEHISSAYNKNCSHYNGLLQKAIRKYGKENFTIKLLEQCPIEDLNDREIYWIDKYNSFKEGYNLTIGGEGNHIYDYDVIFEVYEQTQNIYKTARIFNCDRKTVRNALAAHNIYNDQKGIPTPVYQLDTNYSIINKYITAAEAAREMNVEPTAIRKALDQCGKQSCGYYWCRVDNYENYIQNWTGIEQLDKDTEEIINRYKTLAEAAKAVDGYIQNISKVCKGQRKTAYGYKWRKR